MCASDVTATLDQALAASGLDHTTVTQRPRLLSDNGSSYVAGDLGKWLEAKGITRTRRPVYPQTQGKIEQHQTRRTAFCSTTTTRLAISNGKLTPSSGTITMSAITRASTI